MNLYKKIICIINKVMNLFKKIIYKIRIFFNKIIFPKIEPFSLEKELKEKNHYLYMYKFPDNTIFVGSTHSLDCLDFLHYSFGRGGCEPICVARRKYPNIYPEVLLNFKYPRTLVELNIYKKQVLESYPEMRVLNTNLE